MTQRILGGPLPHPNSRATRIGSSSSVSDSIRALATGRLQESVGSPPDEAINRSQFALIVTGRHQGSIKQKSPCSTAAVRGGSPDVGNWHYPDLPSRLLIWSLPGCNRTFSDPESTLQQCNTQKLTQSLIRSGLQQLHYIGLRTAEEAPCRPLTLVRCMRHSATLVAS